MSVLELTDAKLYLNITGTGSDAELQTFIDAAEAIIAEHCGPLTPVAYSARVQPVGTRLGLPSAPVASLTAVTPAFGTALTLGDLYLDERAGVVTYNSGAAFTARYYDVEFLAGRIDCPDDLLQAVKVLLRHLWTSQRGNARPGPGTPEAPSGVAYSLPNRVAELIAPHLQAGFA